jgi:hypothetical protein
VANFARLLLTGGPFDCHEVATLPPDVAAPAQIVWSGWTRHGFTAWLYEWHGERTMDGGYSDALIYRPTGRQLAADEIPPLVAQDVEVWAEAPAMIASAFDVPPEMMWPGL